MIFDTEKIKKAEKNMWYLFKKRMNDEKTESFVATGTGLHDGVSISFRQASFALSALLLVSFLSFITGYFLGKKAGFEQFTNDIMYESLSDKMYASFCALCDQNDCMPNQEVSETVSEEKSSAPMPSVAAVAPARDPNEAIAQQLIPSDPLEQQFLSKAKQPVSSGTRYCAHLVGFGTRKAAQAFAKKVKMKKGISLLVKERHSKTARGRSVPWYQVVTDTYATQDSLKQALDTVQQVAALKDIRIVEIASV